MVCVECFVVFLSVFCVVWLGLVVVFGWVCVALWECF